MLVCASRLYQNCVKNLFCWEHYKEWARWYEFLSAANEARFTIVEEVHSRCVDFGESSGQGHLCPEFLRHYETTIKTTKLPPTGSKRLQVRPAASAQVFEITELDTFDSHLPPQLAG